MLKKLTKMSFVAQFNPSPWAAQHVLIVVWSAYLEQEKRAQSGDRLYTLKLFSCPPPVLEKGNREMQAESSKIQEQRQYVSTNCMSLST